MTIAIAFASTDRSTVDQHFGAAAAFVIFEMTETTTRLREVAEFIDTAMDGHEGKLDAKIALLEGCSAVYSCAVGASAVQRLLALGIQPLKVEEGTPIDGLLAQLQGELARGPSGWLAKAARAKTSKDSARFSAMAAEGWDE